MIHRILGGPVFALALLAALPGCDLRQRMYDQPKFEPHEATSFYADGLTSRAPIDGTVARGGLRLDEHLYQGTVDGLPATQLPRQLEATAAFLERGQERYDIYCSPCHGGTGAGNGVIVQRGLKAPPSFHQDRLRDAPLGHYFDVMTNGFGSMFSYASRIRTEDRWAVAAYVRALQLSQNAVADSLPAADRERLSTGAEPVADPSPSDSHHAED